MPQLLKAGGESRPDTLRVCLVWWPLTLGVDVDKWTAEPPHCRKIVFDVLGTRSSRKGRFRADCITPNEKLPPLRRKARRVMLNSIRAELEAQTGAPVDGVTVNIVDWGE